MKKLMMILITIAILGLTGCTTDVKDAINNSKDVVAKQTEESTEIKTEATTECKEQTTEKAREEKNTSDDKKRNSRMSVSTEATTENKNKTETSVQVKTEKATETVTEVPTETRTETATEAPTESCTEAETEAATEAPAPAEVSYSPGNVVSLATSKCQAGGMIKTTDNLANLLAQGQITEDEYNEYYPYDGLGYYSVFVETDLNKAATTSGRLLGSEDAIATYIADMLHLESNPYFLIEYGGVTNSGGQDFYEFRCYR
jgi:hypothetical protein